MKSDLKGKIHKNKKILIIGGAGFIGSWLTKTLTDLGNKVVIIDPQYSYSKIDADLFNKIIKFRSDNLLKDASIHSFDYMYQGTEILNQFKPDVVVNLAAISLEGTDDPSISKKQLVDQTILVEKIVSDVKNLNIEKFIFMSSVFAYGDIDNWSSTEKTPLNAKTPYGISKAIGEMITKAYLNNWNIVRTTSIYGFGDINMRVAQIFINRALKNQPFWVNKDALLDFTYVKDLVAGITSVIFSEQINQDFQIAGGKAILLPEFVMELKKYFPKLQFEIKGEPNDRPQRGTMDITKARILLNWQPKFSLNEGLKDYISYVKKYNFG